MWRRLIKQQLLLFLWPQLCVVILATPSTAIGRNIKGHHGNDASVPGVLRRGRVPEWNGQELAILVEILRHVRVASIVYGEFTILDGWGASVQGNDVVYRNCYGLNYGEDTGKH